MAEQNDTAARRDAKISDAIATGRINYFSAGQWRKMLDDDEQGATALMDSLTPILLPPAAATANFSQAAIVNARRQEELDRIEELERAEALRTAKTFGLAW